MERGYPTLHEIREAHSWKRDYEKYLPISRFVFRPVGFLLTWVAIRVGLTTEAVSWLSGIVGIAGCLCLMSRWVSLLPVGIGLLLFFNLLDCVDGSIARATGTQNPYGRFLDSVLGSAIDFGFFAVVGIMSYRHTHLLHWPNPTGHGAIIWLVVGELAAFLYILTGYTEHTYEDQIMKVLSGLRNKSSPNIESPSSRENILRLIDRNLRVRETHYFLLIFAYLGKAVDLFLAAFAVYYALHTVWVGAMYCARGRRIRDLICNTRDDIQ